MAQPSGRIIQIGAVVGDIDTGKVIDRFSVIVNPNEQLSEFIIGLTGITQDQVDEGITLEEGYWQLCEFHRQYASFINAITWGGGDIEEIKKQMHNEYGFDSTPGWPFGRRWIDAKTIWVSYRIAKGEPIQGGLAKSLTKVGLAFKGRKHNAQDDAENTFYMYCAMLKLLNPDRK